MGIRNLLRASSSGGAARSTHGSVWFHGQKCEGDPSAPSAAAKGRVKPAESAQGNLLFDAPPAHYKLRIADENEDHVAYIDIPLSFGAEAPSSEVPAPLEKKQ